MSPKPYFIFAVCVIAAGAIPKGYDEGGFSASIGLESFVVDFNLLKSHWKHDPTGLANRKANITSFGVLGAAFGSIGSLFINDRLGRLRSWRLAALLWASGILMQVFSSGIYGFELFARIWGGLGAGAMTVITPLFLSEIAPTRSRGTIVSVYMVVLLTVLSLGFFINYAAQIHIAPTRTQYRLVQAVPMIPVGIAFIGSFALDESPRWLASKDMHEQALAALSRLRSGTSSDSTLSLEISIINQSVLEDRQNRAGTATRDIIRDIVKIPTYRNRFFLGVTMHTIAQWTGGNGITYYIPEIFGFAGVSDSDSLISSGAYGVTKLVFTMIYTWFMVDIIGRRKCFLSGLILQLAAHVYMAIYMGVAASGENRAASNAAIASIFIYAVGWSIGLCTIPYLYGTEIFPTRIRNFAYAVCMALHWFFQFAVVRVTPNMFVSLHTWGAYVFWAAICLVGIVVLGLWAPETKRVPMERMGELFDGPWYTRWRAKLSPQSSEEILVLPKDT